MRIILADDQMEVRSGLKTLLEQEDGLQVINEASELAGLIIKTNQNSPDLVLLDWELTCLRVSDIVPLLRALCPGLKVVAMSGRPESIKSAQAAGVDAFISKGEHPEKLMETILELDETKK